MTARPSISLDKRPDSAAWAETSNPLLGIGVDAARAIYDSARSGSYARIQLIYREIEAADPTLFTVRARRSAALSELDWDIRARAAGRTRGYDAGLAQEQRDFLTQAYGSADNGGNLASAIEHLGTAFFRGYAHARPILSTDGLSLDGFELLNQWNFNRDPATGQWFWNPSCAPGTSGLSPVPPGELTTLYAGPHIDYPSLEIYIRRAVGDRKYGVWLERYGVPPVIVIMPPDIDKTDEADYSAAAERVARGATGALPNGSSVQYADSSRGVDPFSAFLRRQQELIVLMATGGTLTTLSSPTGIGGGATDSQEAAWRSIVRRDARAISETLNKSVTPRLLSAQFPGRPQLAYFDFADKQPTSDEVFDTAAKAVAAGYTVSKEDLEERTGYTLVKSDNVSDLTPATPKTKSDTLSDLTPATAKTKSDTLSDLTADTDKTKSDTLSDLTAAAPKTKSDTLSDLTAATPKTKSDNVSDLTPDTDKTKSDNVSDLTPDTAKTKSDTLSDLTADTAKTKSDNVSDLTPATDKTKSDNVSDLTPAAPKTKSDTLSDLTPDTAKTKSDNVSDLTPATDKTKSDNVSDLTPDTAKTKSDTLSDLTPATAKTKSDTLSDLTAATPKTKSDTLSDLTADTPKTKSDTLSDLGRGPDELSRAFYDKMVSQALQELSRK